jgi:Tfp pilus assembly protein PilE
LLQEVQNFERCRATNFSYTSCTLAQLSSPEGFYDLTITAQGATNYTLTATATGVQASDTACNVMTINDRNVRTPTADCWPN